MAISAVTVLAAKLCPLPPCYMNLADLLTRMFRRRSAGTSAVVVPIPTSWPRCKHAATGTPERNCSMQTFELLTVTTVQEAVKAQAASPTAQQGAAVRFIAGGTNLVDYMKLNVESPRQLIDINGLPLDKIEAIQNGGLKIGALARNSDVAHNQTVKDKYAVLSEALLSGASTQLRNMATTAGNILQKTRCIYYRDTAYGCNKRQPGTGCSALGGHNRMLAILGTSDKCIATNPSDQNVALVALDATVHIVGSKGERAVPIAQFYLLPGQTPERETVLEPGDLITHITIPALP